MEVNYILQFIRKTFNDYENVIPLHNPVFIGNEKKIFNRMY